MYEIPSDAKAMGYKETRPYHFEQIFYSASCNFTGTEREFAEKGFGYKYEIIDKFTRRVI